jgi:PRTRC genetic system protein B
MNSTVSLGGIDKFTLTRAFLLYASNGRYMVTAHDIEKRGGIPRLGAARPITRDSVHEMVRAIGMDVTRRVLPENVLCYTDGFLCWWTPAQSRPLFFLAGSPLAALNGKELPIPPMVWVASGRADLRVRVLPGSARPTSETRLLMAPFWNVSHGGDVCTGSARTPNHTSPDSIADWEAMFFGSEFSHQLGATRVKKGGLNDFWMSLLGCSEYPTSKLIQVETLGEFVGEERR